jgi:hypothetical protein
MVAKSEWEVLKSKGCFICRKNEKSVGVLHKAHIKAKSRGGTLLIPLCPNHHALYDRGDPATLKKLGISEKTHTRSLSPKKKTKNNNPFDW